jgi:hypothetical protein
MHCRCSILPPARPPVEADSNQRPAIRCDDAIFLVNRALFPGADMHLSAIPTCVLLTEVSGPVPWSSID